MLTEKRKARRTLSNQAALMLKLGHEIDFVQGSGPEAVEARDIMAKGRYLMAARLIAGSYIMGWEDLVPWS